MQYSGQNHLDEYIHFQLLPEFDRIKKKEGKKRGESGKIRDFKKA